MDEQKIPLPPWLPWATTACLAALVACLGELWILERARMRLMQEQVLLANAALKGAENQLEAERILDRREHAMERGEDMSSFPRPQGRAPPTQAWDPHGGSWSGNRGACGRS